MSPAINDYILKKSKNVPRKTKVTLLYTENRLKFVNLADLQEKIDLLCELNVRQQVRNVGYTSTVQQAWKKGKSLTIHGWIYCVQDGLLKNLGLCASNKKQLETQKYC